MDQHSGQVVVPTWPHVLSSASSIVASVGALTVWMLLQNPPTLTTVLEISMY